MSATTGRLEFARTGESVFHVQLRMPGRFSLELDTAESARRWHAGRHTDPASVSVVIGFALPSREAVDERHATLTAAGHEGRQPPFDALWGARYAMVADPDGNDIGLDASAWRRGGNGRPGGPGSLRLVSPRPRHRRARRSSRTPKTCSEGGCDAVSERSVGIASCSTECGSRRRLREWNRHRYPPDEPTACQRSGSPHRAYRDGGDGVPGAARAGQARVEDPQRPLTDGGADDVTWVAHWAVDRFGVWPRRIIHSGKTRSRQTAQVWARLVDADADAGDGLAPNDDPTMLAVGSPTSPMT